MPQEKRLMLPHSTILRVIVRLMVFGHLASAASAGRMVKHGVRYLSLSRGSYAF
jgi:hypothetical protein